MKTISFVMVLLGLGATGLMAHKTTSNPGSHLHGTSVFHRYLKTAMNYAGPETETPPTGQIQLKHNQQGKSDREQMFIKVTGLAADTTYHLLTWMGDDPVPMELTTFTTRGDGKGFVKFKRKQQGTPKQGKGGNKFDLPNLENPVDDIQKLAVVDDLMKPLLGVDLDMPEKFQYLIKRELTNDEVDQDAEGVLHLKANHNRAWFRLRVGGLDPDSEYGLAANGVVMETILTDETGSFDTTTTFDLPLDVFTMDSLSILNGDDESVLSTDFP